MKKKRKQSRNRWSAEEIAIWSLILQAIFGALDLIYKFIDLILKTK